MALTKETSIIKPNFESIPDEMKQLDRWVMWRAVEKKGKITKEPYTTFGNLAKSDDSKTWTTFESVNRAYSSTRFEGIGFMLGEGYVGIDIDGCIDGNGELSETAKFILNTVDSFYEISVSGTGIHVFLKGEIPTDYMPEVEQTGITVKRPDPHTEKIELFRARRYFTVTGVATKIKPLNHDQSGLEKVLEKFFQKPKSKKNLPRKKENHFPNKSNDELWSAMFKSKSGQAIKSLYNGDLSNHDNDHSSADQALCNYLAFWTNKDPFQMDSMFRESGLMREDKWDKKHYSDGRTYGQGTIEEAIRKTNSTIGEHKSVSFTVLINDEKAPVELERNQNGKILSNSRNAETILTNPPFKGVLAFDGFKNTEAIRGDLPWRKRDRPHKDHEPWLGADDKRLLHYFGKHYDIKTAAVIQNAYIEISRQNSFHPVKEYLESHTWDGMPRIETVFIDYLGANDTPYVRAVTRKWFVAAVTRIYEPGCKFDYMPVLVGPQGAKKSSTIEKLASEWFSDSLKNFDSKEAGEHLQNSWIFEFGELAAMKKGEVEEIKAFITKRVDSYRVAYDRVVSEFPRKCVFIGTTNKKDFLRDETGNRRFWAITVEPKNRKLDPAIELTEEIVSQIWAESMFYYKQGENLYLDDELESVAMQIQEGHMEEDPRKGLIQKYLEIPLPNDWDNKDIWERRQYLDNPSGNIKRTKVCAAEIWAECLGNDHKNMKTHEARTIYDILRKLDGWEERNPSRIRFKHYGLQTTYIRV